MENSILQTHYTLLRVEFSNTSEGFKPEVNFFTQPEFDGFMKTEMKRLKVGGAG